MGRIVSAPELPAVMKPPCPVCGARIVRAEMDRTVTPVSDGFGPAIAAQVGGWVQTLTCATGHVFERRLNDGKWVDLR